MRQPAETAPTWAWGRVATLLVLSTILILGALIWKRQREHLARTPSDLSSILTPQILDQFVALDKDAMEADAKRRGGSHLQFPGAPSMIEWGCQRKRTTVSARNGRGISRRPE
jgi:hypothetical protein